MLNGYENFKLEALQLGTVETGLVKYYEKLGWHFTTEEKLDGNHVVYMMEKQLVMKPSLNKDKTGLFSKTGAKHELRSTPISEIKSKL